MVSVSGSCYTLVYFLLLQGLYLTLSPCKNSQNYNIFGIFLPVFLPTVTAGTMIDLLMEESGFCDGTTETPQAQLRYLPALQLFGEQRHCLMSTCSFHAAVPGCPFLSCQSFPVLEHGGECAPIPSMFISFLK